jgi:outer membrane protein OmpA-like peptidoglycan-associated protein
MTSMSASLTPDPGSQREVVQRPEQPAAEAEAASDPIAEALGGSVDAPAGPVERQAARLSKTNDAYHGGVAQRAQMARQLQRRLGNRQVQRVVERAQAHQAPADPHHAAPALARLPTRGPLIQRDFTGAFPTALGQFDVNMIAKNEGGTGKGTNTTGMQGTIKFTPTDKTPYTNKIGLVQIVKLTNATGANVDPASMPAASGPKLRTAEDKKAGVEKGFFTDVLHQDFTKKGTPVAKQGSALPPYYPFSSTGGQQFGFNRSKDAADKKAAELFDFPGIQANNVDLDFRFETVAKADDTLQVLGAFKWAFDIRKGKVVNEAKSVSDAESATFKAALEKHRDFYVHEPVTFYFGFDQAEPLAGETDKIDTFLDYLRRFPDVRLDVQGFADLRGDPAYNRGLSQRRTDSIVKALRAKGIDAARINPLAPGGETTQFTKDAVTKQEGEANRRGNRRVMVTFVHTPGGGAKKGAGP